MPSPPIAIIDTNVFLAGLATANGVPPFAPILDGMRTGALPFGISQALIDEYASVLRRAELSLRHGLCEAQMHALIETITRHGRQCEPVPGPRAPDPGDQFLWDLLAAEREAFLVTLDKQLLRDRGMRGRIMPPGAYLKRFWPMPG